MHKTEAKTTLYLNTNKLNFVNGCEMTDTNAYTSRHLPFVAFNKIELSIRQNVTVKIVSLISPSLKIECCLDTRVLHGYESTCIDITKR